MEAFYYSIIMTLKCKTVREVDIYVDDLTIYSLSSILRYSDALRDLR